MRPQRELGPPLELRSRRRGSGGRRPRSGGGTRRCWGLGMVLTVGVAGVRIVAGKRLQAVPRAGLRSMARMQPRIVLLAQRCAGSRQHRRRRRRRACHQCRGSSCRAAGTSTCRREAHRGLRRGTWQGRTRRAVHRGTRRGRSTWTGRQSGGGLARMGLRAPQLRGLHAAEAQAAGTGARSAVQHASSPELATLGRVAIAGLIPFRPVRMRLPSPWVLQTGRASRRCRRSALRPG